ncbi:MAG TPA: C45 family autoproteolytic acyltransferase/hydrolase, partial [Allocoleopsis sp.]
GSNNNLSLLEVLQNYPSSEITIDGVRLARLGKNIDKFKQSGGVGGAVVDLEGWLVQLQASAAEEMCVCNGEGGTVSPELLTDIKPVVSPAISESQLAEFLPANWQPVSSHREDRGIIKVVWLQGTPYEMGYQHGKLLHDEIASIGDEVLTALRFAGKGLALGRLATRRSYDDVVAECQGLADATQDIGMTVDACMVLAYGDVYQEIFSYTLPKELFWDGCNQFVAANQATADGRLYHGSSVDNDGKPIPYIINNPVVFVRQPTGKLPHAFVTYPGVVWPNSGVNVAGISLGLDTAHPADPQELALDGRSNVQIMRSILETATNFEEASGILETQPRVRANLIMITDGKTKQAGVFEFTGKSLEVRPLQENGVLYVTNHFVTEEMYDKQPLPIDPSSKSRFERFQQLMEPDGVSTYYGKFEPETMVKVLRDRVNPNTMQPSPFDVFDDNASPGGNGSLRQALYDPDRLLLWV